MLSWACGWASPPHVVPCSRGTPGAEGRAWHLEPGLCRLASEEEAGGSLHWRRARLLVGFCRMWGPWASTLARVLGSVGSVLSPAGCCLWSRPWRKNGRAGALAGTPPQPDVSELCRELCYRRLVLQFCFTRGKSIPAKGLQQDFNELHSLESCGEPFHASVFRLLSGLQL